MAWIDDRIWCHPKLADVSDKAFRTYVNGIAYSTGFGTRGGLTSAQQKLVGSDKRVRVELVAAGLWDETGAGTGVAVHDWDEHNSKRDARRAADRDRKRKERAASAGASAGRSAGPARVDGSEGSEGSDRKAVARGEPPVTPTNSLEIEHLRKAS